MRASSPESLLADILAVLGVVALSLAAPDARAAPPQDDSSNMVGEPSPAAPQPPPEPAVQPQSVAPAPPGDSPPAPPGDSAWPTAGTPAGPVAPPPAPLRPRKGLMFSGWTALGVFYLATAGAAAIALALSEDDPYPSPCSEFSPCYPDRETPNRLKLIYIPVLGPFIAITAGDTPRERYMIAVSGVLQLAALTVGIVGTVQYVRDRRTWRVADVDGFKLGKRLRLGVAPTRFLDGGSVTLGGSF